MLSFHKFKVLIFFVFDWNLIALQESNQSVRYALVSLQRLVSYCIVPVASHRAVNLIGVVVFAHQDVLSEGLIASFSTCQQAGFLGIDRGCAHEMNVTPRHTN